MKKDKGFDYKTIIVEVIMNKSKEGFTVESIYEEVFKKCVTILDNTFINKVNNVKINKDIKGFEKLKLSVGNIFVNEEKKEKRTYEKLYNRLLGDLKYEVAAIIKFNLGDFSN